MVPHTLPVIDPIKPDPPVLPKDDTKDTEEKPGPSEEIKLDPITPPVAPHATKVMTINKCSEHRKCKAKINVCLCKDPENPHNSKHGHPKNVCVECLSRYVNMCEWPARLTEMLKDGATAMLVRQIRQQVANLSDRDIFILIGLSNLTMGPHIRGIVSSKYGCSILSLIQDFHDMRRHR